MVSTEAEAVIRPRSSAYEGVNTLEPWRASTMCEVKRAARIGERGEPCGTPVEGRLKEVEEVLLIRKEMERFERKDLISLTNEESKLLRERV